MVKNAHPVGRCVIESEPGLGIENPMQWTTVSSVGHQGFAMPVADVCLSLGR
jgi:hypothetical protein